ncbi:hypothetical protein OAE36_02045 [bacterium]|nr:hypothetical protein [bacterium]
MAKLADRTVAVYEKHYARLDMAVKAKELTEFEFGKTGGGDYEFMQYLSLINRSERQRLAPFRISYCITKINEQTLLHRLKTEIL